MAETALISRVITTLHCQSHSSSSSNSCCQPRTIIYHPNPKVFSLNAWLLSTSSSQQKAFHRKLANYSQPLGGQGPRGIIQVNSDSSVVGVIKKLIYIQQISWMVNCKTYQEMLLQELWTLASDSGGESWPGQGILPPDPILSEDWQEIAKEYLIISNNLLIKIINNSIKKEKKKSKLCARILEFGRKMLRPHYLDLPTSWRKKIFRKKHTLLLFK